MSTPQSFATVFTIQNNFKMKIPPTFVHESLGGHILPEIVSLKDRYGNLWQVKVSKTSGDLHFTSGWSKFVRDNSIISGDILFFEYSFENLFIFKLIGPSGVDKRGLGSFIQNVPQENQNVMQGHGDGLERMDEDTLLQIRAQAGENIVQEDRNIDNDSSDHQNEDTEVNENDAGDKSPRSRVNYNHKCYGMEIFNAGLAPQPRNPYFVVKFAPNRKADLFVPSRVIKDHNLDVDQHMTFVDPNGIRYLAKRKRWSDGRVIIAGGWKILCKTNRIEDGDTCICEFIQKSDRNLDLRISFVRKR